jgi:hypothetical protein
MLHIVWFLNNSFYSAIEPTRLFHDHAFFGSDQSTRCTLFTSPFVAIPGCCTKNVAGLFVYSELIFCELYIFCIYISTLFYEPKPFFSVAGTAERFGAYLIITKYEHEYVFMPEKFLSSCRCKQFSDGFVASILIYRQLKIIVNYLIILPSRMNI